MEATSSSGADSNPILTKVEVKFDPDATSNPPTTTSFTPAKVKKEESDDDTIDKTLPEAEEDIDMFDDVDAPEYVDLTYEGIAEVDGVNCFVCEEFKIRQIPKPVIITRPLYQLFDCIESKHIILDPDYQREVVWDEGRAALLINSILMGYFIPPIIFNCVQKIVKLPDGTKQSQHKRICVDGKQRLTSVWKFMTGQIGFFDSNTPQKKWYFCHPIANGRQTISNRNILPNAVKEFFKNQAFCCYEYDELTVDTEETMFQLVQRGIALTPAEKMRAMSTEWATFTKQYEDDYPLIINLAKQNRASGFRLVLTIFTMIQEVMSGKKKRSTAPTLQASPQALLRVLDDKAPINPVLKLKLKAVFDRYETLVKLSSTQLTTTRYKVNRDSPFDPAPIWLRADEVDHVRTFSPLELVGTAILITVHGEKRTDAELLEDLKEMRHYLRVQHKDLRVNAQCWATTWEFIISELDLRWSGQNTRAEFLTHEGARLRDRRLAAAERAALKASAASSPKSTTPQRASGKGPAANGAPPERLFPNLIPKSPTMAADADKASNKNGAQSFTSSIKYSAASSGRSVNEGSAVSLPRNGKSAAGGVNSNHRKRPESGRLATRLAETATSSKRTSSAQNGIPSSKKSKRAS